MKTDNQKYYWGHFVGLIISAVFFCLTAYLQIRDGYARDESIYVPKFIGNGLWILLFGSMICGLIFLNVFKLKNKKLSIILSSLTLVLLIIFGLIITIGWFIFYNQLK